MNVKVKIGNKGGIFTIIDQYYLAAGGEANIYINGGRAFKIYHDANKTIPQRKIEELGLITNDKVIIPQDLLFDANNGNPIGYVTKYVDNVEPLLKFFTRTFKQDNNINFQMIAELVKQLQLVTTDIHAAKCLIVDFNELNILVNISKALTPYFIDVDSYATPNFRASAIMDSVRDRRVSKTVNGQLVYNPDIFSDWYSWAILSFWLYTNIHPFRGSHPNYKPKDKQKQMEDGISIFHKGVKTPPSVNGFNVIPKRHLDWFEAVFLRNERGVPPLPDGMVPLTVPPAVVTIKGNNKIDVTQTDTYAENILYVMQTLGVNYFVTAKKVYGGKNELMDGCEKAKKVLVCKASDGSPITATLSGTKVTFADLIRKTVIGTITSNGDMIVRNNCIYTVANGNFVENSFGTLGVNMLHKTSKISSLSIYNTKIYEGCIIENLLGKYHLTVPYRLGACFTKYIPQLEGYRVVDAKSERNVTVILAEQKGKYDKFIIIFNKNYNDFDVRKIEDVSINTINFTVMDSGLCIMLNDDGDLELFTDNKKIEVLNDAPFDNGMKLFNTPDGVFFINNNSIHKIKKK